MKLLSLPRTSTQIYTQTAHTHIRYGEQTLPSERLRPQDAHAAF
jgi:hypothetical protein